MNLLRKYWDQEMSKMVLVLVKVKNKSKKQKELLKKLREVKDNVKEEILSHYLDKCKHENAVKFFDWRKKIQNH